RRASSLIGPAAYPDSVPAVTRRHPSPARSGGIESNTEEMTVSEEREVAVRKEMAGMYEESVTGERVALGGAPGPTTAPAAPTPANKPPPATMHSHGGRAHAKCRNGH